MLVVLYKATEMWQDFLCILLVGTGSKYSSQFNFLVCVSVRGFNLFNGLFCHGVNTEIQHASKI